MNKDSIKRLKTFWKELWPQHSREIFSNLYYTYHPSGGNYALNPMSEFSDVAWSKVEEALEDGMRLGLIDEKDLDTVTRFNDTFAGEEIVQSWIEALLMYDVLRSIMDDFRHYRGEMGIDETGKGKYLDDDLRHDWYALHNFAKQLESNDIPVSEFVDLTDIELIEPENEYEEKNNLSEHYNNWWKKEGRFLNEDEINNKPMELRRHLDNTYSTQIQKLPLENNKYKVLNLFEEINKDLATLGVIEIDSHMMIGGLTTNPIVRQWVLENIDPDKKEKLHPDLNPHLVEGDVIELIYMDDPWNPIPVATKGVVMGFEKVPHGEDKVLVSWIIGPDKMSNMPMIPEVDVWRKIVPEEEINVPEQLDEQLAAHQQIEYGRVSQPQTYGNRQFVFFTGTNLPKDPAVQVITLTGPNGDVTLDSLEVKNAKFGGIQVNYNRDTQQELDKILDFVDPTKECMFSDSDIDKKGNGWGSKWNKGGSWKNKLFGTIQNALKDVYSANVAGPNEPTKFHLPNGIINVPGTDAAGTTVGWSILNFFNTHPIVRKILISEYENYVNDNNLPCRFLIDEFTDWIKDNKYEIFGGGELLNRMVKANQGTWINGQRNETASMDYLKDFYGDEWTAISVSEPGIIEDATGGVDMTMVNTTTNDTHTFQAKPLDYNNGLVDMGDGRWLVNSGWLHWYDPQKVDYYVFTNASSNESYIFKNEGQRPESGGQSMIFNYPPMEIEPQEV